MRFLENSLEHVTHEIERLSRNSLVAMLESLIGRRERKVTDRKDEEKQLQAEFDECAAMLETVQKQFEQIQTELESLSDVGQQYETLFEQKRQLLAEAGSSNELLDVESRLSRANTSRRGVRKAVEIGEIVLERVQHMTRSLGRAKTKLMFTGPAVGINNAIARQGTSSARSSVSEGLAEFARCLQGLDLSANSELDKEILRVADCVEGAVAGFQEDRAGQYFCDMSMSTPLLDRVQEAMGLLKHKLDQIDGAVRNLEGERHRIVETGRAPAETAGHS
jgi:DNA repair exonuclease SbcCD ATPase subunit